MWNPNAYDDDMVPYFTKIFQGGIADMDTRGGLGDEAEMRSIQGEKKRDLETLSVMVKIQKNSSGL
jgi:hypothetical protein